MSAKLQKYKIEITRGVDGAWTVCGYWRIAKLDNISLKEEWSLDGAPRMFHTRKEALEFCANQSGIPE